MKKISIIIPCYNEEENVFEVHKQVKKVLSSYEKYSHEIIFIDNASIDKTVQNIKEIINEDRFTKLIVNSKNFGQSRSPFYAMLNAYGDAVILMVADLQTPAETIHQFIKNWEQGHKIVLGRRRKNKISRLRKSMNWIYYKFMNLMSEDGHIDNFIGFGLYDKSIIDLFRNFNIGTPYLRGLINEIGFEKKLVDYSEPQRLNGKTKNNIFSLISIVLTGLVSHSKAPLRFMIYLGLISSIISLIIGICYLILKLIYWDQFIIGLGPLVIGVYFIGSILLFSLGIVGEYIVSLINLVKNRPLVIEKERINFD